MKPITLIAPHQDIKLLLKKNGNTDDIIEAVMYGDARSKVFTGELAKRIKSGTKLGSARNIHAFLKRFIPYKIDPPGKQYIQSPGYLWHNGKGDCKSFSVFTGSILQNLNIPYGYRFVSYDSSNPTPTHVYVYVPDGPREIIIDAVWTGPFNTQKRFEFNKDLLTSHAAAVAGIGSSGPTVGEMVLGGLVIYSLFKMAS